MVAVVLLGTFQNAAQADSKVAVNTGMFHTVVLKKDGTVWAWGYNSNGQLGDGTCDPDTNPVQVINLTDVKAISTSDYFSLALKSDGTVWGWGSNYWGQLGDNTRYNNRPTPVQVLGLNNVIAISAGMYHSLALKSDGTVWAWGLNNNYQLGNTNGDSLVPVQVPGLAGVEAIAAGGYFSAALKYDGTVWAWGSNSCYQLGNLNPSPQANPFQVGGMPPGVKVTSISAGFAHGLALMSNGTVMAWGSGSSYQLGNNSNSNSDTLVTVQLPANTICEKVVSGKYCGYAVAADGTIYGWGMNTYGQLGNGSFGGNQQVPAQFRNMKNVESISGYYAHSVAVKSDGTLRSCGENSYGRLGISIAGTYPLPLFPTCINLGFTRRPVITGGTNHSLALKSDGTVKAWGNNGYGNLGDGTYDQRQTPVLVPNLSDVVGISAGEFHSVALKTDGTVWTCGKNDVGQLGRVGSASNIPVMVPDLSNVIAVSANCNHTLALKSDGTVWAWGWNHKGQLGDGTQEPRFSPVPVLNLTGIVAISAGSWQSFALKYDGTVYAWGYNQEGQLGNGIPDQDFYPEPVQIALCRIVAIDAGGDHSLALADNGVVWAWGRNGYGQLGLGNNDNARIPLTLGLADVMAISANGNISFAIKSDHTVLAWGQNQNGELDQGTVSFGENAPVPVTNLTNFDLIGTGANHAFAYKSDDGSVWGWGLNTNGQIGDGTISATRSSRVRVLNLNLGRKAAPTVEANYSTSLALKRNGIMRAWGRGNWGQLGCGYYGDQTKRVEVFWKNPDTIVDIATTRNFCMALTFDGLVYTWGLNNLGQLGIGNYDPDRFNPQYVNGLKNVIDITTMNETGVALKEDGTVWTWGSNDSGQLGDGNRPNGKNVPVQVLNLTNVVAIGAGSSHCLAVKADGTVWAWGDNSSRQCGDDTPDTYKPTPVKVLDITSAVAVVGGSNYSLALLSDGTVCGWGDNTSGQLGSTGVHTRPFPVGGLSNVKSIDASYYHSLALLSDGTVKVWGDGQFSPGSVSGISNAIAITTGYLHSLAVISDGTVMAWGCNGYGQLGDGTYDNHPIPFTVPDVNLKMTADLGGTAVPMFCDNFEDGYSGGWTKYGGTWSESSGQYSVNVGAGYKSIANGTCFYDMIYEADVRVGNLTGDAGLIFKVSNPTEGMNNFDGYYVGISAFSDYVVLGKMNNNSWTQLGFFQLSIDSSTMYHLKVVVRGSNIKVYVNYFPNSIINVDDSTFTKGAIGVRTSNPDAYFDNIVVQPYLYNDSLNSQNLPAKIEAENYSAMFGVQTEYTQDVGDGKYVGWIDANDWMDYNVNVRAAGFYKVEYRVASPNNTGKIQLRMSDGTVLATNDVPNTTWWETWQTITASVYLTAGPQTLRIYASGGGFNINWFKVEEALFGDNFNDNSLSPAWTLIHNEDGPWNETSSVLKQFLSTRILDPRRAIISNSGVNFGTNYTITAKVRVDSWTNDFLSRAGVGLYCNTSNGYGFNLVFHQDHNTVQFLNDLVAFSSPPYTFPWSNGVWYWFKLKIENENLFGKVWQDGLAEPSGWPYTWTPSVRPVGYPSVTGGTFSGQAVSFDDVTVTNN